MFLHLANKKLKSSKEELVFNFIKHSSLIESNETVTSLGSITSSFI